MKYEVMAQMFSHLICKSTQCELSPYEEALYNQLCVVLKQRARLDEVILYKTIKEAQDVIWPDKDKGGTSPSDTDVEEHRSDGESPEV